MITHLSIQGLAIIESLSIEFTSGFNVITGETGAGKSILIRGLNFLMGGKAASDAVRKGNEAASVTGAFQVPPGHRALAVMDRHGIAPVDGAVIIRRQLSAKGRSHAWVNDTPVTPPLLREIGMSLVDVFGQHENQRLMETGSHTAYVDSFLPDPAPRARVTELSRACHEILAGIEETLGQFEERTRAKDYLAFRLETLKKFGPTIEDYERLVALCGEAETSSKLRETLVRVAALLDGGEEGLGAAPAAREASRMLALLPTESAGTAALSTAADEAARQLDDLSYEIGRLASRFDADEGEIEAAQTRLYGYQDLLRKHNLREIGELCHEVERLDGELKFLDNAARQVEALLHDLKATAKALRAAAVKLTKTRETAAATIKRGVEAELQELAMPGARLQVEFTPARRVLPTLDFTAVGEELAGLWAEAHEELSAVGDHGAERAEFLLAANPGEPLLPLTRVASGGEMSRIMLALKKAIVADAETCVLVFDEIDSGISGRVADVVGRKMQELASAFQVICISHLPQVAVYADTHFLVRKGGKGTRTESTIVKLPAKESAEEIARLLSGAEVSTPSLANAVALIERARGLKNPCRMHKPARTARPRKREEIALS